MTGLSFRAAFLLALSVTVPFACGVTSSDSGSNTNWLRTCNDDNDCSDQFSCLCGVCTSACEVEEGACSQTAGQCTDMAELGCVLEDERDDGACLPSCSEDAECESFGSGLACESGVCIAETALEPNPPSLEPLSGPARVALGSGFACVTRAGRVWCWGANARGQITESPSEELLATSERRELEDVTEVVAGGAHACALTADGSVYCWGLNDRGQVGPESAPEMTCISPVLDVGPVDVPCQPTPTRVAGVEGATGLVANNTTTCAWFDDGSFTCWGEMSFIDSNAPELSEGVRALSLGNDLVCAILSETDELWCGAGDPPATARAALRAVDLVHEFDGGPAFGCALDASGRVDCWGRDDAAQRGLASFGAPIPNVDDPPAIAEGAREVSVGQNHACALLDEGSVVCWGRNDENQTGAPRYVTPRCAGMPCQPSPTLVAGVPLAAELDTRGNTTCILSEDAELYCWGGTDDGTPWRIPGPWEGDKNDCHRENLAIASEVLLLRQEAPPFADCTTDSDCAEVDLGVSCYSGCASAPVHRDDADAMLAELARFEDMYCSEGCNFEGPECPKQEGTLACVAGVCVRFDADATECEDACACALLEQLANSPPNVETQCEGHHLMLHGFVPCASCSNSRMYFAVANHGQTAFAGEATIELEAPETDLDLPEPMTLTLSLDPGEHSEPLYFEFDSGPGSAMARIVVDDNCSYMSEWSDFPLEIPAIPICSE